ncbi:translesion error-prone DNA polymerase V autoproteolytic subunit [Spirosoma sp. RP8]|uniref:Translesion error-prone DNA polymerase V autoproteolytic subunit n=1 Tax=Spirosoma liriopis TaxID=2937440 RepID=A0ABT0HV51_9BACT|nr:translesion error-prone DNA polymerase V autoproteolytic subunit [Spirosoma liriopis]MCK8496033.1 translesion error-prone DNA polymerase V autoproteolytic subunit [Spirosoma liriopis]
MSDLLDTIPIENIFRLAPGHNEAIPLFMSPAKAGFPSPAEPFIEQRLNLHDLCVPRHETAYFVKASGDSMTGDYIYPGSILVVDSSVDVDSGKVIVAAINGEWCVKRFVRVDTNLVMLESSNAAYAPIYVHTGDQFEVLGVVTYIVSRPPRYVRPS